jgi:hypothetical protein
MLVQSTFCTRVKHEHIIDGSAGVTTNAGGSVNPSTNVEGINYSCRAWVNFNGTGTVAIRASGNVTSITDNGLVITQ